VSKRIRQREQILPRILMVSAMSLAAIFFVVAVIIQSQSISDILSGKDSVKPKPPVVMSTPGSPEDAVEIPELINGTWRVGEEIGEFFVLIPSRVWLFWSCVCSN
jgi:hypothetical protein